MPPKKGKKQTTKRSKLLPTKASNPEKGVPPKSSLPEDGTKSRRPYSPPSNSLDKKQPQCPLFKLPNELIANVLSWTAQPLDILSLSLTCKSMHKILTHPSASFMWKHSREKFTMITRVSSEPITEELSLPESPFPLPPGRGTHVRVAIWSPVPVPKPCTTEECGGNSAQTEAQLAQFLIGTRACALCSIMVNNPPYSVNLKLVLCQVSMGEGFLHDKRPHLIFIPAGVYNERKESVSQDHYFTASITL